MYNPRNNITVPGLIPTGDALVVRDMARLTLTQTASSAARRALFVTNFGHSSTLVGSVNIFGTTVVKGVYDAPTLDLAPGPGAPTSGRAMKTGVSILNTTRLMDKGGAVRVLTTDQRLALPAAPDAMTFAQWDATFDSIAANPKTVTYSGSDFSSKKLFIGHPVDVPAYNNFVHWEGPATFATFMDHITVNASEAADRQRPMSTTIVLFEAVTVDNSYDICAYGHWYTRWPLDTILGKNMSAVRVASAAEIAKESRLAQDTAAVPRDGGGIK